MLNLFIKISLYFSISLISMSCESSINSMQEKLPVQENVDLRSLNLSEKYDQNIIQAVDDAATILGEKSPYTGFNEVKIHDYKILYDPENPDELLIYYQDKLVSKNQESNVILYKTDTYFPYINQQSAFFSSKDNKINYNNGERLFRDFNLDGIDGVFKIDEVENKTVAAFIGGTVSPIELFYKGQKCEILSSDVGIGCCNIDNKEELMQLNSSGWKKIEQNDKFSCE